MFLYRRFPNERYPTDIGLQAYVYLIRKLHNETEGLPAQFKMK